MDDLKTRLSPDFHHVAIGDDARVFDMLTDPAYNLAVWENAASQKVIQYFESLTEQDIKHMLDTGIGHSASYSPETRDYIANELSQLLPSKDGKPETIAFLMHMNEMFYHFIDRPFVGAFRLNKGIDTIQGMHADNIDFRAFVSLSRYADENDGDGSTRFINNSEANAMLREAYPELTPDIAIKSNKAHIAEHMIKRNPQTNSLNFGVGNVSVFAGAKSDRIPLFHSRANLTITKPSPSLRRVAYILSPTSSVIRKSARGLTV